MIRGLFFDLDGTLVDTHRANYEAYKHALGLEGFKIDFDQFKQTIGMHAGQFLPLLAPGLSVKGFDRVTQNKAAKYREIGHTTTLNTNLRSFIEKMKPRMKIALVTTAKRVNAEAILQYHDLTELFDTVITADDVKVSKPDPEAYVLALDKTKLHSYEVIAFEDSETGRKAAESAGIAVVVVKDFHDVT
jgi:HAD superfamily hydrolase (TIGR01509 family)